MFSRCAVPDVDGLREDGLSDGSGELDRHCLGKVKLLQPPQEEQSHLGLFGYGAYVDVLFRIRGAVPRNLNDSPAATVELYIMVVGSANCLDFKMELGRSSMRKV